MTKKTSRSRRSVEANAAPKSKQEKRAEAKRERERIRRAASRRRRLERLGVATMVVLAIAGVAFLISRPKVGGGTATATERRLLAEAGHASKVVGCEGVRNVGSYDPASEDQSHIGADVASPPPLSSYASVPPASGPHDQSPLPAGIYSSAPPVYRVIHSLEHGAAVVWYDPAASGAELERIRSFFGQPADRDHVIVAPYDYPTEGAVGSLPAGTQMALVAWHNVQTCERVSLPVAFDFVAHYRSPPAPGQPYKGEAPEPGAPV